MRTNFLSSKLDAWLHLTPLRRRLQHLMNEAAPQSGSPRSLRWPRTRSWAHPHFPAPASRYRCFQSGILYTAFCRGLKAGRCAIRQNVPRVEIVRNRRDVEYERRGDNRVRRVSMPDAEVEASRFYDIDGLAHAGGKPQDGPRVLRYVGLVKRKTHEQEKKLIQLGGAIPNCANLPSRSSLHNMRHSKLLLLNSVKRMTEDKTHALKLDLGRRCA